MVGESAFPIVQRDNAAVIEVTGSIGVHSLLRLAERLKTTRRRLVIVAPAGTTSGRVLEIAGMAAAYPLFDSVEDAIASLTR